MDTTELQNQAIEIRDAENEGENTALRVGTMLLAIIEAFANIVDLDTLQQILEQYAGTTGSGQIYWRHARCVFLASMGADFDAVNGDGWEYTNHNGDIVFNPTSKNLRVVGETGTYFVAANVLYVHAHTCHAYKWDAAEQKMVEITDTNLPTVITYKNTPVFSQVAIGESYVFQSQSSGPKIAIKISSSETYSFLPDPKKIYAFRDIRQAMLWKPSNQTWVSLTPRVINNLTTGGEGDALSAEMGKWLYTNLYMIFSQLGAYAFPNGKPQIDWGGGNPPVIPPCTVSKTIGTGLSSTGGDSDIAFGDPLEVSIAITDNLYIVDDDSVAVTMGGSPVQGAWNASTMKVNIAAVTGNVVINVPSLTYVGYGEQNSPLAFMLDCKNRGNQSGHWIDLIGNIDFTLGSSVVAADTGVVFDGTLNSYGETDSSLVIPSASGTIDAVVLGASATYNPILINPADSRIGLCICTPSGSTKRAIMNLGYTGVQEPTENACVETGNVNDFAMSMNKERYVNKGTSIATNIKFSFIMNAAHTKLTIGRARRPDHSNDLAFVGTIKAIRVYNSVLTAEQQLQNWKVDKKRFNIS